VFITGGIFAGIAFAALTDIPLEQHTLDYAVRASFLPAFTMDWINAVLLVPLMLYNHANFDFRSTGWWRTRFVRQLLVVIVISAVLPLVLTQLFPAVDAGGRTLDPSAWLFRTLFLFVLILAFTIANALLLVQSISRRILQLTDAAEGMAKDQLAVHQIVELESAPGDDPVAQLAHLFGRMAREVIQREELLKRQIVQMQIQIDEAKQARRCRRSSSPISSATSSLGPSACAPGRRNNARREVFQCAPRRLDTAY